MADGNNLRYRSLMGDDFPCTGTKRNTLLFRARYFRANRAWMRPGCYAWCRYTDYLKNIQREMLEYWRARNG